MGGPGLLSCDAETSGEGERTEGRGTEEDWVRLGLSGTATGAGVCGLSRPIQPAWPLRILPRTLGYFTGAWV